MNTTEASNSRAMFQPSTAVLDAAAVKAIRHDLHELANVFTGVMIAGDLLSQQVETESLQYYAANICEGSERGCDLLREIRSQLMFACGEVERPESVEADSTMEAGILEQQQDGGDWQ